MRHDPQFNLGIVCGKDFIASWVRTTSSPKLRNTENNKIDIFVEGRKQLPSGKGEWKRYQYREISGTLRRKQVVERYCIGVQAGSIQKLGSDWWLQGSDLASYRGYHFTSRKIIRKRGSHTGTDRYYQGKRDWVERGCGCYSGTLRVFQSKGGRPEDRDRKTVEVNWGIERNCEVL